MPDSTTRTSDVTGPLTTRRRSGQIIWRWSAGVAAATLLVGGSSGAALVGDEAREPPVDGSLLAAWPAPPVHDPSALDDVPRLLPTVTIPNALSTVRREHTEDPGRFHDHYEVWFGPDGDSMLTITTNVGQQPATPPQFRESVEIPPWDEAFYVTTAPETVHITLVDPDGYVTVNGDGLDREIVTDVARSLTVRADGAAGWEVPAVPDGLIPFGGGWGELAVRTVQWRSPDSLLAELTIARGYPSLIANAWYLSSEARLTTIGDAPAVATDDPGVRSAVAWLPEPGVVVRLGTRTSLNETLRIAQSVQPVDAATWETATTPDISTNDGCSSMFC